MLGALLHRITRPRRRSAHPGSRPAATRAPANAWWAVLGFEDGPPRSLGLVERRYRKLVSIAHPDRGGSDSDMQRLNWARAQARRQLAT